MLQEPITDPQGQPGSGCQVFPAAVLPLGRGSIAQVSSTSQGGKHGWESCWVQVQRSGWGWESDWEFSISQLLDQIAAFILCLGHMSNYEMEGENGLSRALTHFVWLCIGYKLQRWIFLNFTYGTEFLPSVPTAKKKRQFWGKCRKSISCRKHCFNLNFIDMCLSSLTFGCFVFFFPWAFC